jgi:hypothetical protein
MTGKLTPPASAGGRPSWSVSLVSPRRPMLAELRAQRVALTRLLKAKPEGSVERDPAVRQAVTRQFDELLHHLRSHTTEPQPPEAKVP